PQHGVDEDVTAQRLRGVLSDQTAEGAFALLEDMIPLPAAAAGVAESEGLIAVADIDAGERIADPTARRQFHVEELPLADKGDARDREALPGMLDGVDRLAHRGRPKFLDVRMPPHPSAPEAIDFLVRRFVLFRGKTSPSAKATLILKREVGRFADGSRVVAF